MLKKIFFIALIIAAAMVSLHAQESILNKEIKYRAVNRDLSNVLVDISKKSGINIVFKITDVPEKSINLYAPGYTLKDILDYVLQNTDLSYEVLDKQIVIYKPQLRDKEEYLISGYVRELGTGEKMIYTNIYTSDHKRGTISNAYGYYSIKLPRGKNTLNFSFLGYYTKSIDMNLNRDTVINVYMKPEPAKLLNELLIESTRIRHGRLEFVEPEKINIDRVHNMVHLFGEDDILRFTYIQPGVLTGADGFGGIHVRGGNTGDNLILLDGVPVYNSQHALGLFSIFNSSVINDYRLLKGDFPARYGGSLSSIMDIRTREGNRKRFSGEAEVGLLTFKTLLEGPLFSEKSPFVISFRRTFMDIWQTPVSNFLSTETVKKDFSYYFYDFNIKQTFTLDDKNSMFISYYKGTDKFSNEVKKYESANNEIIKSINNNNWDWHTELLSLHLISHLNKELFINTSLFYSHYDKKSCSFDINKERTDSPDYIYQGRIFDSKIYDYGLKLDFDYKVNEKNYYKFGYNGTFHSLTPFIAINYDKSDKIDLEKSDKLRNGISKYHNKSFENRLYFEDKIKFGSKTNMNLGLHFVYYIADMNIKSVNYHSLEPRLIFNHSINDNVIFNIAITRMSQYVHTLSNNGLGLPSDVLLPTTEAIKPEKIWHFNTAFNFALSRSTDLSITAYYKYAKDLVSHKQGSYFVIAENSSWANSVPQGKGKMYGLETELKYNTEKLNILFNYTYSRSLRAYDGINDGEYFEYRFSRKHFLNFMSVFKVLKKMNLYLTFVYGSGNPYTIPTQLTPDGQLLYEQVNNWQLPDYQRLDVGMITRFSNKHVYQQVKLGVYNVLNRANPFYMVFNKKSDMLLNSDFKEIYVFPMMPSLSYKIVF